MKESIVPMDEHSEPSRVPTSAEPSSAAQRPDIKLLVVEDDAFMQLTMKMMLESIAEVCSHDSCWHCLKLCCTDV